MACQSAPAIMDEQALLGLNPNADACYRQRVRFWHLCLSLVTSLMTLFLKKCANINIPHICLICLTYVTFTLHNTSLHCLYCPIVCEMMALSGCNSTELSNCFFSIALKLWLKSSLVFSWDVILMICNIMRHWSSPSFWLNIPWCNQGYKVFFFSKVYRFPLTFVLLFCCNSCILKNISNGIITKTVI